jgi:ADP-ribosyl-[dinitrogen reductase] hydrolase
MRPDIYDRILGALIGLGIGDALGAPWEFHVDPPAVDVYLPGVFGTPPGGPTDDTDLAIRAALACTPTGFSAANYVSVLIAWLERGPADVGGQTAAAIQAHREGRPVNRDSERQGNGAVMAVAPLGLAHAFNARRRKRAVKTFARVTHPATVAACRWIADTAAGYLHGASFPPHNPGPLGWRDACERAPGPSRGWCWTTATIAVGASAGCRRPDAAIPALLDVIHLGGDTDTNGAVTGALLGARFGMAAWPDHLVDGLYAADALRVAARHLHAIADATGP